MIGEINLLKVDLGQYLWRFTQQIERFAVGFLQVNPGIVVQNDREVGESAATLRGGDFATATNNFLPTSRLSR